MSSPLDTIVVKGQQLIWTAQMSRAGVNTPGGETHSMGLGIGHGHDGGILGSTAQDYGLQAVMCLWITSCRDGASQTTRSSNI
jgi:hypothetical protein